MNSGEKNLTFVLAPPQCCGAELEKQTAPAPAHEQAPVHKIQPFFLAHYYEKFINKLYLIESNINKLIVNISGESEVIGHRDIGCLPF